MDDLDHALKRFQDSTEDADFLLCGARDKVKIALQIAELRKSCGLSQKRLAEMLSTKQSAISRIEHGNINITVEMLMKIAATCGRRVKISFV